MLGMETQSQHNTQIKRNDKASQTDFLSKQLCKAMGIKEMTRQRRSF